MNQISREILDEMKVKSGIVFNSTVCNIKKMVQSGALQKKKSDLGMSVCIPC